MNIIDGKVIAGEIKEKIKNEIEEKHIKVTLAVVLVGNNPASLTYIKNKKVACEKVGISDIEVLLDENISQDELNDKLDDLSKDESVDAILLQLPLPKQLDERQALTHIAQTKDVDGLTNASLGAVLASGGKVVPCTPKGVLYLIKSVCPSLQGKNAVIIGRSNLVGKPTAMLLLNENATVTICHSKTKNLKQYTKNADILVSAAGKIGLVTRDMVKKGAIVIDVGITKDTDGKNKGDVDFKKVAPKTSFITPVPGGVGPMTIAMLLDNALILAKQRQHIE